MAVCHIVFCGRLEARFLGQTVVSIACPCSVLAKPCKSRTFQPLTVHSKTSFSVHFLFSAACELWRRSRDSISPGWTLGRTLCRRPHSVLAPYPGKSPLPASRFAARPTSGTTYSRPRKKWSGGRCGCPHCQGAYSSRPHNSSTPGGSGRLPVSSVPVSCGKGNRPACALAGGSRLYGFSLMCSLHFSFAVLPEKASCPIPAACSNIGTLPGLRDILSRSGSLRCFPCRGIPFRTVIHVFKVQLIDELP